MNPNFFPWIINTIFFSLLGVTIVLGGSLLGFKLFDKLLPEVHFQPELQKGNIAVGIVIAATIMGIALGTSIITAAVLMGG